MKYEHLKTCTELDREPSPPARKLVANESELSHCFELFPQKRNFYVT